MPSANALDANDINATTMHPRNKTNRRFVPHKAGRSEERSGADLIDYREPRVKKKTPGADNLPLTSSTCQWFLPEHGAAGKWGAAQELGGAQALGPGPLDDEQAQGPFPASHLEAG